MATVRMTRAIRENMTRRFTDTLVKDLEITNRELIEDGLMYPDIVEWVKKHGESIVLDATKNKLILKGQKTFFDLEDLPLAIDRQSFLHLADMQQAMQESKRMAGAQFWPNLRCPWDGRAVPTGTRYGTIEHAKRVEHVLGRLESEAAISLSTKDMFKMLFDSLVQNDPDSTEKAAAAMATVLKIGAQEHKFAEQVQRRSMMGLAPAIAAPAPAVSVMKCGTSILKNLGWLAKQHGGLQNISDLSAGLVATIASFEGRERVTDAQKNTFFTYLAHDLGVSPEEQKVIKRQGWITPGKSSFALEFKVPNNGVFSVNGVPTYSPYNRHRVKDTTIGELKSLMQAYFNSYIEDSETQANAGQFREALGNILYIAKDYMDADIVIQPKASRRLKKQLLNHPALVDYLTRALEKNPDHGELRTVEALANRTGIKDIESNLAWNMQVKTNTAKLKPGALYLINPYDSAFKEFDKKCRIICEAALAIDKTEDWIHNRLKSKMTWRGTESAKKLAAFNDLIASFPTVNRMTKEWPESTSLLSPDVLHRLAAENPKRTKPKKKEVTREELDASGITDVLVKTTLIDT